ncbi:glycosyltransferase [Enterovibrio norvegicus]|uniref:glycosyltransferase n=1 Tax=Enterovibrio norvegicus TaxID=188144 RepID=UPI00352DFF81
MKKTGISICYCSYNRRRHIVSSLLNTLDIVSKEKEGMDVEVIVVDNNSSDNTYEELEKISGGFNLFFEPTPGLSHARNKCIREAEYNYVAFIDDDAYLHCGWLKALIELINKDKPKVIGGRILPRFEGEKPIWLSEKYYELYSILDMGREVFPFPKRKGPVGANMVLDTSFLGDNIYFNTALGRVGSSLLSGEEVEYIRRYKEKGAELIYCGKMTVDHVIPSSRLDKNWIKNRYYFGGYSDVLSQPGYFKKIAINCLSILSFFRSIINYEKLNVECEYYRIKGTLKSLLGIKA